MSNEWLQACLWSYSGACKALGIEPNADTIRELASMTRTEADLNDAIDELRRSPAHMKVFQARALLRYREAARSAKKRAAAGELESS